MKGFFELVAAQKIIWNVVAFRPAERGEEKMAVLSPHNSSPPAFNYSPTKNLPFPKWFSMQKNQKENKLLFEHLFFLTPRIICLGETKWLVTFCFFFSKFVIEKKRMRLLEPKNKGIKVASFASFFSTVSVCVIVFKGGLCLNNCIFNSSTCERLSLTRLSNNGNEGGL